MNSSEQPKTGDPKTGPIPQDLNLSDVELIDDSYSFYNPDGDMN